MNIYLDIDGTLIANELNAANHAEEFLNYILKNFPDSAYWLTTHCQGDAQVPLDHIGHLFSAETQELMKLIKPTSWRTAKTEAIDFSKPFLWFDDDLYPEEKEDLQKHGALNSWVQIDLYKDPDQLEGLLKEFPAPGSR